MADDLSLRSRKKARFQSNVSVNTKVGMGAVLRSLKSHINLANLTAIYGCCALLWRKKNPSETF